MNTQVADAYELFVKVKAYRGRNVPDVITMEELKTRIESIKDGEILPVQITTAAEDLINE